jgi:hypothetical protein
MNGFLAILVSVSLISLVVGLASPEMFRRFFRTKTGRTSVGLSIGSLVVVFFVLFVITAPKTGYQVDESASPKINKTTKPITNNVIKQPTVVDESMVVTPPATSIASPSVGSSSNVITGSTGTTTSSSSSAGGVQGVSGVVSTPPVIHILNLGSYVAPILAPLGPTCKSLSISSDC